MVSKTHDTKEPYSGSEGSVSVRSRCASSVSCRSGPRVGRAVALALIAGSWLSGCASSGSREAGTAALANEAVVIINVSNPNSGAEAVYAWWGPSSGRVMLGTVPGGESRTFTTLYQGRELGLTSSPVSDASRNATPPGGFRQVEPGERIDTQLRRRAVPG